MLRPILIALAFGALTTAPIAAQHGHHDHAGALDPAAEPQLDEVRAATARYRDHAAAVADGFRRFEPGPGDPLMGEHWYRADRVREPLDLTRPSTLIYAPIDGERRLVAVAYTLHQEPGRPLPEGFAGDADRWHVHDVAELARIALSDRPVVRWIVENRMKRGTFGRRVGETDLVMLHAWIGMENPEGIFANRNTALPYARAGLPLSWASDEAAARAVALLQPGACDAHVEGLDRMADLDRDQAAAIRAACETAAIHVATARVRAVAANEARALNDAAASVWTGYAGTVERVLTGEQEERLTALRSATRH